MEVQHDFVSVHRQCGMFKIIVKYIQKINPKNVDAYEILYYFQYVDAYEILYYFQYVKSKCKTLNSNSNFYRLIRIPWKEKQYTILTTKSKGPNP